MAGTNKSRKGLLEAVKLRWYWYELWTGTYMLTWWEEIIFNVLVAIILSPFMYYGYVKGAPLVRMLLDGAK